MASGKSSLAPLLRFINVYAFLRWWGAGLVACLPQSARRSLAPAPNRLLIIVDGEELLLIDANKNNNNELGRYPLQALAESGIHQLLPKLKDKEIILYLDPRKVLAKDIPLPLAAEANLQQVIGFEIDRLTPFPVEKIYYDACVLERQPSTRQVRVRFAMVVRTVLDTLTKQLSTVGIAPDVATVAASAGSNPQAMDDAFDGASINSINLLPVDKRPRRGTMARRVRWVLLALVFVSAMAAAALPLWQQRNSVVILIPQAHQAELQAEEIFKLRKTVDDSIESANFLLQKRKERPLAIDLLNELTIVLPDNTWVEQLNIRGDELQVRGQSLEASQLISLVEDSAYFYDVTFRSPVSRDRRTGRDRFYLSAQIVNALKPGES